MIRQKLPSLTHKQWAGFVSIYLSGVSWLACIIIPFTALPGKIPVIAGLLILAEILFFSGVALLGHAYYRQIKAKLLEFIKSKPKQ